MTGYASLGEACYMFVGMYIHMYTTNITIRQITHVLNQGSHKGYTVCNGVLFTVKNANDPYRIAHMRIDLHVHPM